MISPNLATLVLLVATVILLIIIPILDSSKRFGKFVSLRYTLVCVSVIMALGCVLDFSHLMESSRNIVLMGAFILIGIFVLARSLEKLKLGAKEIELEVHKGDVSASAKVKNNPELMSKDDLKTDKDDK